LAPWEADPERIATTQDYANTQARQFWQRAAWGRSANVTNVESADRPLSDSVGGQGSDEPMDLSAADAMTLRRAEDERYAWFMEATVIQLDLPDAVFRGYEGDEQLLGAVRDDDLAPIDLLRREILRLEPQMAYFPLGIGGHVDHQLCREAGVALLDEGRQWVMPGPDMIEATSFYEDFPYAWWHDFSGVGDLPDLDLPAGVSLQPRIVDISDTLERKSAGLRLYRSQVERLFESEQGMRDDLAGFHARTAIAGGQRGYAERTWAPVRA
jgi:LmbE family N-acetylglucosaminyl deacetylase